MKLFSTLSLVAPITLIINAHILMTSMVFPCRSVISAKILVRANRDSNDVFGIIFGICMSSTGKIRNVRKSQTPIPALIIHPKFITGKIPLRTNDPNPTTVVRTAKVHGLAMNIVESRISWR